MRSISRWAFMLGLLTMSFGSGTAAAEDVDPAAEPAVAALETAPPVPSDPFTVASAQSKDNPVGTLAGLLGTEAASSTAELANQGVGLTGTPPYDPLGSIGALSAQNFRMPRGDEASPYMLQTNVPAGPFARVDAFKGAHALGHAALGRIPGSQLGSPVAGTAPPPGTNLPPGLEQFYVPPEAPGVIAPPPPLFPSEVTTDTPVG